MLKLLPILTFMATSAFAINTKDCPSNLQVKAAEISITKSIEQVLKGLESHSDVEEYTDSVKLAHGRIADFDDVSLSDALDKAKNGRCIYQVADSIEKIELYSKGGVDHIYFQKEVGPRGILVRIYGKIASLSTDGVELTDQKSGVAMAIPRHPYESYTAGGELIFIGIAGQLDTYVKP